MSRSKYSALKKLEILEQYKDNKLSDKAFANQYGTVPNVLKNWQVKYERDGIDGLKEATKNKHYSKSLKQNAVNSFINGEGTLVEISSRFGLRSKTQLEQWLIQYNRDKEVLASPVRKRVPKMSRKTTFDERIEIVEYVTKSKHKYAETAEHFQVTYQQVRNWVLKTKEHGYEALIDNRGHRKLERKLTELEMANLRIRQLESELADKELLEEFIKKFQEIQHKG